MGGRGASSGVKQQSGYTQKFLQQKGEYFTIGFKFKK